MFSATKVTDSICENVGILGDRLVPIAEADEYLSASSGSDDVLDDALARVQAGRRQS